MWNSFKTDSPPGVIAEPTTLSSRGDEIHAYMARPAGDGRRGGVVLIHHMPGWDEFYLETARTIFQDHDLPSGRMRWHQRQVKPAAIKSAVY